MSDALARLHRLLQEESDWRKYSLFHQMYPDDGPFRRELYPKHIELYDATATFRHICMMGGNGAGKTTLGAFWDTVHATGLYPHWWRGKRFHGPIQGWVAGKTKETVRDITQAKLIGNVSQEGDAALGTGMIPRELILDVKYIQNTNKAADYVTVKHVSGGSSVIGFKSYDQGRKAFEGTERHIIHLDEEPPSPVMSECVMRGRKVDGQLLLTFTPLQGFTDVVMGFLNCEEENRIGASKCMVRVSMDDVPHLSDKEKTEMLAGLKPYEREARRLGIPVAGAGKVYPVEESDFVINPIQLPDHFRRVGGFDGGWYNTAAVWIAYDKDNDVAYVYSEYKAGELQVQDHATRMKARGHWIPFVGDAAAINQGDGEKILDLYRRQGIRMKLADKSVDSGIQEVLLRLGSGRLKVFSTCQKLLDELRTYSYDEEQRIRKQNDHLADALRYAMVSGLKIATTRQTEQFDIQKVRFG